MKVSIYLSVILIGCRYIVGCRFYVVVVSGRLFLYRRIWGLYSVIY